jgi:transcriptional regulator with XRE-family HTH domain
LDVKGERLLDVKELRDLVRQARIQAGMTQQELAEAVGMSQRWVSNIETGDIEESRTATLHKLAAVLPVTVEDLIIAAKLAKTRAGARRVARSESPSDDDPIRAKLLDMLRRVRLDRPNRVTILRTTLQMWMEEDQAAAASTSAPALLRGQSTRAAAPSQRRRSGSRPPGQL